MHFTVFHTLVLVLSELKENKSSFLFKTVTVSYYLTITHVSSDVSAYVLSIIDYVPTAFY